MPKLGELHQFGGQWRKWDGTGWGPNIASPGSQPPTPPTPPTKPYDPNDPSTWTLDQQIAFMNAMQEQEGGGSEPAFSGTAAGMQLQADLQAAADQRALDGQKILQGLGFDFQNMDRTEQQTFQATQALLNQAFQTGERIDSQTFQTGRDQFQADLQQKLQGLGFDQEKAMLTAQQTFTALESQKTRELQIEQAGLDRGLTREQMAQALQISKDQMAATAADNAASRALQERLTMAGFEHDTAERIASQTFQAAENEQERAFKMALQQEGFDQQTSERIAGQVFTAEQAAMDRQMQKTLQEDQQTFSSGESAKDREARLALQKDQQVFEKEKQDADLKFQRQKTYVDMMGKDPVRAVLFAMGIGKDAETFNTQWGAGSQTQAPLEGAEQSKQAVEKALSGQLGKPVTVGGTGVEGLGSVEGAARAFQKGGGDVKTLLSSAFGVGNVETGGATSEDVQRRIQAVTPTGVLPAVGR